MSKQDKLLCTGECGKERKAEDFYVSHSPIHKSTFKLSICKDCLVDLASKHKTDNEFDIKQVQDTLRRIDRPFLDFLWDSSIEEANNNGKDAFKIYMKNLGMKQYREMTWDDSNHDLNKNSNEYNEVHVNFSSEFKVTDQIIDKWGAGYTPDEYQNFERKYSKLIKSYGEKTAFHTEGLITYIRYRVKEELATAKGEVREAKEWGQLASKQAQDAKINVSQLSKSDISGGVDVLSQLYEAIESQVSIIPLLPKVLDQPYDDVDLIIWALINYNRRLEDKESVPYRDIWTFYDEMLEEHFSQKGYGEEEIEKFKQKRNNVFRDLSEVYVEPVYEDEDY